MKKLADGTTVTSRSYYFLLDFNDGNNWEIISSLWGVMKLHELTIHQYRYLFRYAVKQEMKHLNNKLHEENNEVQTSP